MTTQARQKPNWFAASRLGQFMGLWRRAASSVSLLASPSSGGGLLAVGGPAGVIMAAIGLVPLLAGAFDMCVFSALVGGPLSGAAIRACARR